jgi:hypothetical protein
VKWKDPGNSNVTGGPWLEHGYVYKTVNYRWLVGLWCLTPVIYRLVP